jgi:hypothetical protein
MDWTARPESIGTGGRNHWNTHWSLWKSETALFGVNQPDFFRDGTNLRAWADAPLWEPAHVPLWQKYMGTSQGLIWPGEVWMHGAERDRTGSDVTSVVWTSPGAGTVVVTGALWSGSSYGRVMHWRIRHNEVPVSEGSLTSDGTFTRTAPLDLAAGSGGPAALVMSVAPGDRVQLLFVSASEGGNLGDAVGLRLHVQFATVSSVGAGAPQEARLLACAPNPFNPRTTIRFDLPAAGATRLDIYDVAGRLVRTLVAEDKHQGSHEEVWDGRDAFGTEVSSGTYLARLEFGGRVETMRMGLVR